MSKSEIWVDGSFSSHRAGIGIDSQWVVGLLSEDQNVQMIYGSTSTLGLQRNLRRMRNLCSLIICRSLLTPKKVKGVFFQPQFTSVIAREKFVRRWIIRVHDIFPVSNPEWFRPWARTIFLRSFSKAINQNAIIVCSSFTTRSRILALYPQSKGNVLVLPCFPRKFPDSKCESCEGCSHVSKLGPHPFFLAVGTIEPRKGFDGLAKFWSDSAINDSRSLVIVGRKGWKSRKIIAAITAATRNSNVFWLKNVCDGSLNVLYQNAQAFISSSLDEGFNLPALEARANFRLPLILSDIPVHQEYHSDAAHFFENFEELENILLGPLNLSKPWDTEKMPKLVADFKKVINSAIADIG